MDAARRSGRYAAAALLAALLTLAAIGSGSSASPAPAGSPRAAKVLISGVAYSFDNQERIGGALIRVAELPGLRTRSRPSGRYVLAVPDGARVTPYIEAERATTASTCRLSDIERPQPGPGSTFRSPPPRTYDALAAFLGVSAGTRTTTRPAAWSSPRSPPRRSASLSFAEFVAYGAHGVAGATARARPALPEPIYFNEDVIPDRSRRASPRSTAA